MKNSKVVVFVKHVVSVLSALAKSNSVAIRNKTGAMKARIMLFSLMKSRKLYLQDHLGIGAISHKIHALLGQHAHDDDANDEAAAKDVAVVVSNRNSATASKSTSIEVETMSGHDHHQYLLEYSYDC